MLFVFYFIVASLLNWVKVLLLRSDPAAFGILVTMSPGEQPVYQFRCVNAFTVGVAASLVASGVYEALKRLFGL
jgi:hypothetical protein